MLSRIPERLMRSIRSILLGGWLLLILSLFYDPISSLLTDPSNLDSPFRITQIACFQFQDECSEMQMYPLGARIFWGMVVPASISIVVVFGHETWRRICPLSFLSQIPRSLGVQRQRKTVDRETQIVTSESIVIADDSWLGRNSVYVQFSLLFAGLCIRLLFANSDRLLLGIYLLGTIAAAIGVGYLYAGKTWCHYFCPMGAVQTVYTGTGGILGSKAHETSNPITQSMCRTIDSQGQEASACVACKSGCMDINAERTYWDNLELSGQDFLHYGYLGLVLGFFLYFPLYTGNWSYLSGPVWNETNQLANLFRPGIYSLGSASIPKIVAVPLVLGVCTGLSIIAGSAIESYWSETKGFAKELVRHRCFLIATFLAFNAFILLGVLPTLGWLPPFGQQLFVSLAIIAITMWVLKGWQRSLMVYSKESLAVFFRRQLLKLDFDVSPYLDGRKLEELTTDEVYVLAKTLPGLDDDRRKKIYIELVRESLNSVVSNLIDRLELFEQLRLKFGISSEDHHQILFDLGIEDRNSYDLTILVPIENQARVDSYRKLLELLLLESIEAGVPLQTAVQLKRHQIATLKQEYRITPEEQAEVITQIGERAGFLAATVDALIEQLAVLNWRFFVLSESSDFPSIQLLNNIVKGKQELVFSQVLGVLEVWGLGYESSAAVGNLVSLYGNGLELVWKSLCVTDNWAERLCPEIVTDLSLVPAEPRLILPATKSEIVTLLLELWHDEDAITQSASLDALNSIEPSIAQDLITNLQIDCDPLVQEVSNRIQSQSLDLDTLQKLTWLLNIEFFSNCGLDLVLKLAQTAEISNWQAGRTLIKKGGSGNEILVLIDGTVFAGDSTQILLPPQVFGLIETLTNCIYKQDIVADKGVTTLVLDVKLARSIVDRNKSLYQYLVGDDRDRINSSSRAD